MNHFRKQTGVLVFFLIIGGTTPASAQDVSSETQALIASVKDAVNTHAEISDKVKFYVVQKFIPTITHEAFVRETTTQNNKNVPLAEIQEIDKQWIEAEEEIPIYQEKLNNACAQELKTLVAANPYIVETFVMDNQGAIVCMNKITSDYWQGDEAKWQNAYNKGLGGLDVGKIKFDKSANAVLQQISLPIIDTNNKVIGAVTFGIDVTKIDATKTE